MALSPTYYDFICKLRPYLIETGEQDAADLLVGPNPSQAIHSVDDYNSRFPQYLSCLNAELLGYGADHPGVSAEEMSAFLSSVPQQAKAALASLYSTVNLEYHTVVNFALFGKKTFHFSDNLAEHLANTEINLKAELIQLPFPTCQFIFTSRAVIDAMHNIRGDVGLKAMNVPAIDYSAPVSVFLTMLPPSAGLSGRKLIMCAWHARLPDRSYLGLKRELYLGDNWTLEQALRTDWETLTPDDLGIGMKINLNEETIAHQDDDTFYSDGLAFYRIVLNALLYLSSDKAELSSQKSPRKELENRAKDIASRPKRRKLLKEAGRYSALDFEEIGASVGPIIINVDETDNGQGVNYGGKPLVRFMVRGHWRWQPHGPESQDRKLIWIRPYYKGPDLAATINKPYLVK